jgi:hypothetical protein
MATTPAKWLVLSGALLLLLQPGTQAAPETAPDDPNKFEITIDTSAVPELKPWADRLQPIVDTWYPHFVAALPSDGFTAPRKFTITFKNMEGVAYTSGKDVVCAAAWFKAHPDDEGAVIHELVHVVQQYRSRRNPGWLVEGVADYYRWFNYEPENKHPRPNPDRAKYTDSYRTTAAFIEYVANNYGHEIPARLNQVMREGRYEPGLWTEYTGRTVDELWAEYVKTLRASRGA